MYVYTCPMFFDEQGVVTSLKPKGPKETFLTIKLWLVSDANVGVARAPGSLVWPLCGAANAKMAWSWVDAFLCGQR